MDNTKDVREQVQRKGTTYHKAKAGEEHGTLQTEIAQLVGRHLDVDEGVELDTRRLLVRLACPSFRKLDSPLRVASDAKPSFKSPAKLASTATAIIACRI